MNVYRDRSTMLSSGWILTLLFPILILQFTAVAGQRRAFFTVKVGDGVTLPCAYVKQEKHNCDRITWTSNKPGNRNVSWFNRGNFTKEAKAKSDRMSVTANCSLVIKNVTADDFGKYICREGLNPVPIVVDLTVTTMTEQRNNETVTFNCSVTTDTYCRHTVVWVFEGKEQLPSEKNVSASCSAAITISASHLHQNLKFYELLKCKVKDGYDKKDLLFTFSRQHSEEKTGHMWTTSVTPTTTQFSKDNQTKPQGWFCWAALSVVMAGLLITVIVIITLKKTKGAIHVSEVLAASLRLPSSSRPVTLHASCRPASVLYTLVSCLSMRKMLNSGFKEPKTHPPEDLGRRQGNQNHQAKAPARGGEQDEVGGSDK
ncbi:uncharacterized protein LOC118558342 [Fundulus heteroclitus]|uniref:uncharacterized protein LOC118558342 n=1 Tax=Fundulus heteroclitus TaxID=8078 RepID=UPI00165C1076|nr:uncharacterized protein LOC118558342 [Fundulus heteroclitus]